MIQSYAKKIVDIDNYRTEERNQLCERLGLPKQNAIGPAAAYHAMSDFERRVWRAYLPTTYQRGADNTTHSPRSWEVYGYDSIPIEALREINKATEHFTTLEIWTPEHQYVDPMAVGIDSGKTYPIVRWGESLKDFDEIRNEVLESRFGGPEIADQFSQAAKLRLFNIGERVNGPVSFAWQKHCGRQMVKYFSHRHYERAKVCVECGEVKYITF